MWEFVVKQLFERLYFHFEFLTSYMSELKKEKKKKKRERYSYRKYNFLQLMRIRKLSQVQAQSLK